MWCGGLAFLTAICPAAHSAPKKKAGSFFRGFLAVFSNKFLLSQILTSHLTTHHPAHSHRIDHMQTHAVVLLRRGGGCCGCGWRRPATQISSASRSFPSCPSLFLLGFCLACHHHQHTAHPFTHPPTGYTTCTRRGATRAGTGAPLKQRKTTA